MTLYDVINSITIKTSDIIGQVFLVLVKLIHTIGQDKFKFKFKSIHHTYLYVCELFIIQKKE